MKAHLMHQDRDFNLRAPAPAQAADLVQDLVLPTLTQAMAAATLPAGNREPGPA